MTVQSHHPPAPTTRHTWIFSAAYECSTPISQQHMKLTNSRELQSLKLKRTGKKFQSMDIAGFISRLSICNHRDGEHAIYACIHVQTLRYDDKFIHFHHVL